MIQPPINLLIKKLIDDNLKNCSNYWVKEEEIYEEGPTPTWEFLSGFMKVLAGYSEYRVKYPTLKVDKHQTTLDKFFKL